MRLPYSSEFTISHYLLMTLTPSPDNLSPENLPPTRDPIFEDVKEGSNSDKDKEFNNCNNQTAIGNPVNDRFPFS